MGRQVLPLMRLTAPAIGRRGLVTELKEHIANECPRLLSGTLMLPSAIRPVPIAVPEHNILNNVAATGAD